jgi:osmotically inducible lipoprotein OsmB
MNTFSKTFAVLSGTLSWVLLTGCAGMSAQEKSTAIGAGAGAVGGAILTGGSTAGTLGGAAVGGYLGHEIKDPK